MLGNPSAPKDGQASRSSNATAQELGLRQYTAAILAQRQHLDDEKRRLSPEPHLEMMRPVSPFKNKRQVPNHQGDQHSRVTHPSAYRPVNANVNPVSGHRGPASSSTSNAHAYRRPTRVQEASGTGLNASTNANASLSKHGAAHGQYKSRPRDTGRGGTLDSQSTTANTNPAVQMLSHRSSTTPASSDTGHSSSRNGGTHSQSHSHAHGQDGLNDLGARRERGYMSSPESVSSPKGRKNPSYRKPAPKFIPTPPSTPPTASANALGTVTEDLVPPMPSIAHVQKEANATPMVKKVQVQEPPPRPARATSVPPSTQFFIPSKSSNAPAKTDRRPMRDAPASSKLKISAPLETLSAPKQTQTLISPPQTRPAAPSQAARTLNTTPSTRSQTASSVPQPSARPVVQTRSRSPLPPPPSQLPPQPTGHPAKVEEKKQPTVYPQPKKVPSLAQLVESARPTRTPSPSVPPKDVETKRDVRIQPRAPSPANVPVISVTSAITIQQVCLFLHISDLIADSGQGSFAPTARPGPSPSLCQVISKSFTSTQPAPSSALAEPSADTISLTCPCNYSPVCPAASALPISASEYTIGPAKASILCTSSAQLCGFARGQDHRRRSEN